MPARTAKALRTLATGIAGVADRLAEGRLSLRAAATEVCARACEALGCRHASIWTFDRATRRMALLGGQPGHAAGPVTRTLTRPQVEQLRRQWVGVVEPGDAHREGAASVLLASISVNGETVGVLRLEHAGAAPWRPEQVLLARSMAKELAIVVARVCVSRKARTRA